MGCDYYIKTELKITYLKASMTEYNITELESQKCWGPEPNIYKKLLLFQDGITDERYKLYKEDIYNLLPTIITGEPEIKAKLITAELITRSHYR